jgi:hypothetical protein
VTLTATVRNETGATLSKGTVVYINGGAGNKPLVVKASASSESGSSKTFAILAQDIPTNQNGQAVTMGLLKGLDTTAFSAGANLWLSTTAGQITSTPPASPNHAVFLGNAVRIHATQGEIEVRIQNGLEIGELHDVLITTPTNGQVLKYDSATSLWKNATDLNSGVWGQITGTLSNQTDLQTALNGKYSTSNPAGYITSSALSPYVTTATANASYYPLSSNPSGYLTSAALSPYLLISTASSTYYPLTNPSGYITSAALSGYATQSWVTSQGYITSSALSPYLTIASASATYQPLSGMSSYLTTSAAAAGYYPLTGNPSGFLTSASLSGYATESFVTSQGYITSSALSGYATESWVTAGFYPLTGNPSGFLTSAALTGYATESYVNSQGFITSSALSGYATESWVTSQGYITSAALSPYLLSSTASSTYYLQTNPAGYINATTLGNGSAPAGEDILDGLQNAVAPSTSNPYATEGYTNSSISSFAATLSTTYATIASPSLTGVPLSPTASPGTNTTQIATTAFVTAAVPAFATTAEINSPSATNKVVSPYDVVRMVTNPALFDTQASSPVFATSGAGAEAYKQSSDRQLGIGTPNVGVAGYGQVIYETTTAAWGVLGAKRGATMQTQNFNKRIWMAGTTCFLNMGDANTTGRLMLGGRTSATTGSPTKQSIGWRVNGGGGNPLVLVTYGWNGSALVVTETTSSFTPVANQTFDWMIFHEPNVANPATSYCYLFVNDTLVATGIYSPADATVSANYYVQTCEATSSQATRMNAFILPTKIWWSK